MRVQHDRLAVHRGFGVASAGFAVALLAVGGSLFAGDGNTQLSITNLPNAMLAQATEWWATPGVWPLEVVAYAGLGLAAAGIGWFWAMRPVLVGIGVLELRREGSRGIEGFEFDRVHEGDTSSAGAGGSGSLNDRGQQGDSVRPAWMADVFEQAGPEPRGPPSAFLRKPTAGHESGDRSSPDASEESRSTPVPSEPDDDVDLGRLFDDIPGRSSSATDDE